MTFKPGDIVVCLDDSRRSSLHESPSFETGDVLTVAAIGDYWVRLEGHPSSWCRDRFRLATDEEKQQFLKGEKMSEQKIEGIPDGWELVRIGTPEPGEWVVSNSGDPIQWLNNCSMANYAIIRKIEKPKPGYQPFANAAEYLPHFGKPIKNRKTPEGFDSVVSIGEDAVYIAIGDEIIELSYVDALAEIEFADGTPFGVEVVE